MSVAVGARRLPGDDVVGFEDEIEQLGVGQIRVEAANLDIGRQVGRHAPRQDDHGDAVAGAHVLGDHRPRERRGRTLQQVEDGGHQNTRARRPRWTRLAISSRVTGITRCPSTFQAGSEGTATTSTWKGTPSSRRFARNLAISSPSTSSSVFSSRRCTPGPSRTNVTSFSPATTPRPMRIASFARWDARGSSEIRTTTGRLSATESVERDEPVRAVDQFGQHDKPAVRHGVGVAQGNASFLAAAHPELLAGVLPDADEVSGSLSSIHAVDRAAREGMDLARERVARFLKVSSQEIVFTSGGTESDNYAVKGLAWARGTGHLIN